MKNNLLKSMKMLLVAAGLCMGANAWADTTIANLTATQVTAFDGATKASASDYSSVWTKETGPTATNGNNSWNWSTSGTYVLWTYKLTGDGLVISQTISGAAAGTYLLKTYMSKIEGTGTASVTITQGGSTLATYNYTTTAGTYYVPFYNDATGDIKFTYSFNGGGTINWGNDYLYSIKEDDATENYTTILSGATTAQIESMIAGMSEAKNALKDLLATANANYTDNESLVGDGVFQLSASLRADLKNAIDAAQAVYDNDASTDSDYETQTGALTAANNAFMTTYNAPDANKYYYLTINDGALYVNMNGYDAWKNGDLMPVLSTLPYAIKFEAKDASKNEYYVKNAEGNYYVKGASNYATNVSSEASTYFIVYLQSDGTIQLQTSWQSSYRLALTNANRKAGQGIGATSNNFLNFTVTEATEASATANITSAQWATFVAPFDVTLPTGVTAYTCTYTNEKLKTTPTGSQTVAANTPVLLYSENIYENEFKGYAQSYWSGLPESGNLVGFLSAGSVPASVAEGDTYYVLQKQNEVVGWYKVESEALEGTANRAYLYVPTTANARAYIPLFGDGETTGIAQVNGEDAKVNRYYNLSGQRVSQPTKGLYIVGGKKVVVK